MTKIASCFARAAVAVGCGTSTPPGEYVYETDVLEITAHAPLCAGTIPLVLAEAERIAAAQSLSLTEPMRLHIGPDTNEDCNYDGPISGCAGGHGTTATASSALFSVSHELAHMIRWANGIGGPDVFEEGLATILAGGPLQPSHARLKASNVEVGPSAFLAMPSHAFLDANNGTAVGAHFLGWLQERHGAERVLEWSTSAGYSESEEIDAQHAAFDEWFSESLGVAEAEWRKTARRNFDFGNPCGGAVADVVASDLEWGSEIDCGDPATIGPHGDEGYVSTRVRCFRLEEPRPVRLELEAPPDFELVVRDLHDCKHDPPTSGEAIRVRAGESAVHELDACTWMLRPQAATRDPGGFSVRVSLP